MATQAEVGFFTAPAGTGDQTVTLADPTITPKWVRLTATLDTADGIQNADGIFSIGEATFDAGAVQQHYVCHFNDDAAAAMANVRDYDTDAILKGLTSDALDATATDYQVALKSSAPFAAGSFTLTWSDVPTAQIKIRYEVLGGSDITRARCGSFACSTAVATQDVTIVAGFGQANLIAFMGHAYTGNFSQGDSRIQLGWAKSATERFCGLITFEDASTTVILASWMKARALLWFDAGVLADGEADVDLTVPSNGFRLSYADQVSFAFLCGFTAFQGTFAATVGSSTMPTITGDQDLALAAGAPKLAEFWSTEIPVNAGIDTGHADLGGFVHGATDGTNEGFCATVDDDANLDVRASRVFSSTKALARHLADAAGGAATLDAECDSSFVGSNVRLNWNDAAAVAAEFGYVIVGDVLPPQQPLRRFPLGV